MGRPLHRGAAVRRPGAALSLGGLHSRPLVLGLGLLVLVLGGVILLRQRSTPPARPAPAPATATTQTLEAVSALGRLEPDGDVRKLAEPMNGMGGSPRIQTLLVEEGDLVRRQQVLATFDSRPGLLAQKNVLITRINSLQNQLVLLERETSRYRRLANAGATATGDLEVREIKLLELKGNLDEARSELRRVETDLVDSELRAPIDGTVLHIWTRAGERPGANGILELGGGTGMEAIAEVYESDIDRIRLGQKVRITSENGGFSGSLAGRVIRISPQVRQRDVLSTDPTGDADARVVEVRLAIDPADMERVRRLAGLKIVTRFES
ncbi:HlyD family efflux transporter periplasmic adaptor subunit [Synechococcus sp. CBW1006]|nr:HlyD family efflux transporter periplasmic adaptor subunit [Synechococcus sp. CBW1006]